MFEAAASMTNYVSDYVRQLYPNTNITPVAFRRLIVTLVHENEVSLPGETMEQFLDRLARSINTSREAMRQHYNRSVGRKDSQAVQKCLEDSLYTSNETSTTKKRLVSALDELDNSGFFLICHLTNR